MYLTPKNKSYWITDIETDGLDPTVIWCCCVRSLETGEEKTLYNEEEFHSWQVEVGPDIVYVGHYIIGFDIPALNKLWNAGIDPYTSAVDTNTLSNLYNPAIQGGHSLEAWGRRLGLPKGSHSDWSQLSPEMISYCQQDVRLTTELYKQLTKKMKTIGYSELSSEIEHHTAIIIKEQHENGFFFDVVRATQLRKFFEQRKDDLSETIRELFPPRREKVSEYTFRRRKDGSPPAQYEKHRAKYSDVVFYESSEPDSEHEGLPYYECFSLVPFNIGSPQQRVRRFLELGWEPTEFTDAGNPKVNEDEILKFAESVEASGTELDRKAALTALAEYLVVSARLSMLAGNPQTGSVGWIGHVVDHGDGDTRIHGTVMPCGAASRRMTHNSPNTANAPSPHKAKYGKEMRELWGVQPNKGLIEVGVDAAGLENVILLHFLNNKKATELFNQKKPNDVHSLNARRLTEALGRDIDREWGAKTSLYACIFGAYPPKLGEIVRGDKKDGKIVQDIIINSIPGFKSLVEMSKHEWRSGSGRLLCIDGGFVICPHESAALNYLIQPAGAIVMKLAMSILREKAREENLWFRLVAWIHDEWQFETKVEDGDRLGKLAVSCIEEAAERLKFKVPLTGAYSIGKNWSECH